MKPFRLQDNISMRKDGKDYMLFDNLSGNIFRINEVSYEILSLCDGKNTEEEIIKNITDKFSVSQEVAAKDFAGLIKTLLDKKYLIAV